MNEARHHLEKERRRERRHAVRAAIDASNGPSGPDPADRASFSEVVEQLRLLPEKFRAPLSLKYLEGYTEAVHHRGTSWEAIKAAYRARLAQYHPDKVPQWLGRKLKEMAERETKRIIRAYKELEQERK